jgi:hypothetical protein
MDESFILLAEIPNDYWFILFKQVFEEEAISYRAEGKNNGRGTHFLTMSIDYYRVYVRKSDYLKASALWKDIQLSSVVPEE